MSERGAFVGLSDAFEGPSAFADRSGASVGPVHTLTAKPKSKPLTAQEVRETDAMEDMEFSQRGRAEELRHVLHKEELLAKKSKAMALFKAIHGPDLENIFSKYAEMTRAKPEYNKFMTVPELPRHVFLCAICHGVTNAPFLIPCNVIRQSSADYGSCNFYQTMPQLLRSVMVLSGQRLRNLLKHQMLYGHSRDAFVPKDAEQERAYAVYKGDTEYKHTYIFDAKEPMFDKLFGTGSIVICGDGFKQEFKYDKKETVSLSELLFFLADRGVETVEFYDFSCSSTSHFVKNKENNKLYGGKCTQVLVKKRRYTRRDSNPRRPR
jgi:hypothetical protein